MALVIVAKPPTSNTSSKASIRKARGDMLSIATETERTLFFDFLPLDLGTVHGFRTRFHLYTVPGQILYERTRMAVLNGADGIVFVVDSQAEKFEENVQSIAELEMNMRRIGKDLGNFPFIMQWNKRDMPSALPVNVLGSLPQSPPCSQLRGRRL